MDRKNGLTGILFLVFAGCNLFSDITIDTAFENGHLGKYTIIQPDTIYVGPISGHRDSWFSFKIKGVKNKKINILFEMIYKGPISSIWGAENAAMVTYDGKGFEIVKDIALTSKVPGAASGNYVQKFTHVFREDEALFSYCAPWSNTKMAELAEKLNSDRRVQIESIGASGFKKLPLTCFKITDGNLPDKTKKKLFLTGREDAYEAGGSWAVEGVIRFLLSKDPAAEEMLKKIVFYIFPIFSVDGVAVGSTNYPLDPENNNFVYVTAAWDKEPPYHEVKLMRDFWSKMKQEGVEFDVGFKFHSCCYAQNHFRPEDCAKENKSKERELLGILKRNIPWREEAGPLEAPKKYMNCSFLKVFPNAITFSSHNDFIFAGQYTGTEKNVYRRHEDILQDGELIARAYAEFFGIEARETAPYLMAGDVDVNNGKKGAPVSYSVYYYDLNGLPPAGIKVVINGKAFKMDCAREPDYKRPVKYTLQTTLEEPRNDYYFTASNGKKERKIPEGDYFLPGPFILN